MAEDTPLDLKAIKAKLDEVSQNIENFIAQTQSRENEINDILKNNAQELSGVKSAVSEHKNQFNELSEHLVVLRTTFDKLKSETVHTQEEHPDSALLRQERQTSARLRKDIDTSQTLYKQETQKCQDALSELAEEKQKFQDAEKKGYSYRVQIGRLQSALTRNATNANEVVDSTVIHKTNEIRARIQSMVTKYCKVALFPITRHKYPIMKEWDDDWEIRARNLPRHCDARDVEAFRHYWVRSKIFQILNDHFFKRRVFGLPEDLERSLAQFENEISERKQERESQVADWRSLTIRCAKTLDCNTDQWCKSVADYIVSFLEPWFASKRMGKTVLETPRAVRADALELCQNAYALTLAFRQSTDTYAFTIIPEKTEVTSSDPEEFEIQDMIGPKTKLQISKIWLTIFGALIKRPLTGAPEDRYVMEKAHVVVRAAKPLQSHNEG